MSRPACIYCEDFACDWDCERARASEEYTRWLRERAFRFLMRVESLEGAWILASGIPDTSIVNVADLILLLRPDLAVLALTLDDAEEVT